MDRVSVGRRLWNACLRSDAAHGDRNEKHCAEQHPSYTHWWIIPFELCMLVPLLSQRGRHSTFTGRDAKRAIAPRQVDQNPANPSGLLYGMATLVTSSSEPSGFVAYPTSFAAFP